MISPTPRDCCNATDASTGQVILPGSRNTRPASAAMRNNIHLCPVRHRLYQDFLDHC